MFELNNLRSVQGVKFYSRELGAWSLEHRGAKKNGMMEMQKQRILTLWKIYTYRVLPDQVEFLAFQSSDLVFKHFDLPGERL